MVHFRQCPPFIGCPEKKPANYYPYIARFLAPHQREVDSLLSHWSISASVHLSLDARKKTRQLLSLHRSLNCSSPARGKYTPLSLVHFRQCPLSLDARKKTRQLQYYPYIARFLAPHQREVDTLLSHWSISASVYLLLDARKKTRQQLCKWKFPPLSLVHFRQCPPFIGCPEKTISAFYRSLRKVNQCLWIRDILLRTRIRIRGSVPLTYGSGSGFCSFRQWLSRCQQKISIFT